MKETSLFEKEEFSIRTIQENEDTWFVAADILNILGLQRNSLGKIKDTWKGVKVITTPGGRQKLVVIQEPGLWKLVMRSNLPKAQEFQDWLAEEVIPSLRKKGYYNMRREELKPTYKELASNCFLKEHNKNDALQTLERAINLVNIAVSGMKAQECKEKYGLSPRDWIHKNQPEKLKEYDRLQTLVSGEIERGRELLQIRITLKTMGYKL